jgi:hypothetical protein
MRSEGEQQAAKALEYLQLALTCARNAQAPRTAAKIAAAISSARGAVSAAARRAARNPGAMVELAHLAKVSA